MMKFLTMTTRSSLRRPQRELHGLGGNQVMDNSGMGETVQGSSTMMSVKDW